MRAFWAKHRKKILIGGGALFLLIVIIAVASGHGENGFDIHVVERHTITEEVEVAGKVKSNNFAELAFEVSGRVTDLGVNVGDPVKQGDVLVRLDTAELQADLMDAQAQVAIKEASLENAEINLSDVAAQQDVIVENARQTLVSADLEAVSSLSTSTITAPTITGNYSGPQGRYKVVINRGPSDLQPVVRTFGIEETSGQLSQERSERLGSYGLYISVEDSLENYIDTIWFIDIPNTRGSSYTTNLAVYEKALRDREVALTTAESSLNQGERDTSIALAELKQAQARVSRIQAQINQRIMRAPFDGIVAAVEIEVGEIASSGTKYVSLVSGGDFEVVLDVPEIDVSKLEVGNRVRIALDAFNDHMSWEGEIYAISEAETYVDGVPVYETHVFFVSPDDRVRSGLSATVTISTETKENVLAIPVEFIERDVEGEYVNLIVGEDALERRNIQTGLRGSDGLVEVLSGLDAGAYISTKPHNN